MNNNMRNKIKFITALFFITMFTTTIAIAQPGGGGGGQGQGGPPPGNGAVPIDGGAILLVIGAAVYGRYHSTVKCKEDIA
jgi:hypothetical protein